MSAHSCNHCRMSRRSSQSFSAGIDEAGRGCVIGPLVVAIVLADAMDRRWFAAQNVRDSKLVPPARRDALAAAIKDRCWFHINVASPQMIDIAIADRSRTLNGLELEMMTECLRDLMREHGNRETHVLIDAPSINAEGFRTKILDASGWPDVDRLDARHHADTNNRTVGAASIIAKAERERLIAELKTEIGCDFGSGYCHDERTIAHIKTAPMGAEHVRWSWATATRLRR
jgi:ribonuclease HII